MCGLWGKATCWMRIVEFFTFKSTPSVHTPQYPLSSACKRIPLDFTPAPSPAFTQSLDAYVKRYLRKGIPSLFVDVRPLYK